MPHLVSSVNSPQPIAEVVPIVRCVADCHSSKALHDSECVTLDRQHCRPGWVNAQKTPFFL